MAEETSPAAAPASERAVAASPIETHPSILGGKPHLRGTRLEVELLQGLLATGWSREAIQEVYPYVPPADLDAALAFKG